MKSVLIAIAFAGTLLFGGAFALLSTNTDYVEKNAQRFIAAQIENKIQEDFGLSADLSSKDSNPKLHMLKNQFSGQARKLENQLFSDLPDRIATQIATMCVCGSTAEQAKEKYRQTKKKVKRLIVDSLKDAALSFETAIDNVNQLIHAQYYIVTQRLIADLKIFTGSNATLFLIILSTALLKKDSLRPIWIAAIFLLAGTLTSTFFYLFNQDWFYTILFNDYTGWAYLIYIGLVSLFLADVLLNRARVSLKILEIFKSAGSLVPGC
ncbi:conserved membrane hypothetical protein [Nitrospina gracilis 3/211]|uniref:Uncharacterized protein n=1 Tax=Nitrospina gracilis (strain 3/211) TaxID=1266370 RepID=M1Z981_NITG3|nr:MULTISPECIES: hypothetical protein [Nitrospina]MCF8722734.1 flagellar hook-basal body complex protein FliE [Nitrospina sp. Nb-3]CCQ89682.1 conserved membrane hypothetical protein [Nitrospina gracilis 3/211]